MMKMIAYLSNNLSGPFTYSYCKSQYVNLVQHCIHERRYLDAERIMMGRLLFSSTARSVVTPVVRVPVPVPVTVPVPVPVTLC